MQSSEYTSVHDVAWIKNPYFSKKSQARYTTKGALPSEGVMNADELVDSDDGAEEVTVETMITPSEHGRFGGHLRIPGLADRSA